jgi:hypothetical protein
VAHNDASSAEYLCAGTNEAGNFHGSQVNGAFGIIDAESSHPSFWLGSHISLVMPVSRNVTSEGRVDTYSMLVNIQAWTPN